MWQVYLLFDLPIKESFMKEVHDLIKELQARLQNAGGGEILITHKTFAIKLGE